MFPRTLALYAGAPNPTPDAITMSSPAASSFLENIRDAFLLERASRRVGLRTPEQQRRIRELYDAATMRVQLAREIVDCRQHGAAFALLKEAIVLYLGAIAIEHGGTPLERGAHVNSEVDALVANGALPAPPPELEAIRFWLDEPDPIAFDRLSHDEALSWRGKIDVVVDYLRDLIDPRTERDLKLARAVRLAAVGLVIVALLSALGWKALAPKNVALGKPVTVSSHHPQTKAPPNGLTDGRTSGPYGVHTRSEDDAWVMVDLERIHRIERIKIYNRTDGWFDEGLPFALELSENGTDFVEVDRRTKPFSRWRPWVYESGGKTARYVRVRKVGHGYVALGELEVYGSPQ